MYNTYIRRGDVSKKASAKDSSGQHVDSTSDRTYAQPIPKVFVVCDQNDTAPVRGYILRQRGPIVILETSLEKATERIDKSLFAGNWTKYALKRRLDFQPLFQFQPLESLAHIW